MDLVAKKGVSFFSGVVGYSPSVVLGYLQMLNVEYFPLQILAKYPLTGY